MRRRQARMNGIKCVNIEVDERKKKDGSNEGKEIKKNSAGKENKKKKWKKEKE